MDQMDGPEGPRPERPVRPVTLLRLEERREDLTNTIRRKQNEFLDVYSFYIQTRIAWIHDELKLKAYELHLLDPSFSYSF